MFKKYFLDYVIIIDDDQLNNSNCADKIKNNLKILLYILVL